MTATSPAAVTLTHGSADAVPPGLDIVYGPRDADMRCSSCGRLIPATDGKPVFDLATAEGGDLCLVCADKQHHGLRLVCAVMGYVVEAYGNGNRIAAEETIRGFQSAIELLDEAAPKVPYRRPVRQQPVRHGRRGKRR